MVQEPDARPGTGVSDHLQDLVLQCADVEELLRELATFSAFTLSIRNEIICGVTLMRHRKPTTLATRDPRVLALDEMPEYVEMAVRYETARRLLPDMSAGCAAESLAISARNLGVTRRVLMDRSATLTDAEISRAGCESCQLCPALKYRFQAR